MASKPPPEDNSSLRRPLAETPEDRNQQMISYADELAEKQLREGTASAMVITHYLKMGTAEHQLQLRKLENESLRLQAQVAEMESRARADDMMAEVLSAVKRYAGVDDDDD